MNKGYFTSVRTWPTLVGVAATLGIAAAMSAFAAGTILDGTVPANHVGTHESMQRWLRIAFLLIAIGAVCRLPRQLPAEWRRAVAAALAVIACAVTVELAGSLGWTGDLGAKLGAADSLERRVFRLGAMAAYAVPMLALLAAGERKQPNISEPGRMSARLATLLVRFEALLFGIGAALLASLLMAAAFINREFTWLSAVGADATVAACVAAAVRARRRGERLANFGWLLVCLGMAIGLLMGIYSFGGPVPAPDFIGHYNDLPRVLLRDGHVILLAIGIGGIAAAAVLRPQGGAT